MRYEGSDRENESERDNEEIEQIEVNEGIERGEEKDLFLNSIIEICHRIFFSFLSFFFLGCSISYRD